MWKICTKCKKHKALWEFGRVKWSRFSTSSRCKDCKAIYMEEYRKTAADKIKKQRKLYRKNNIEKIRQTSKHYKENDPEKLKRIQKESYKKNKYKRRAESKQYYKENKEERKRKHRKWIQGPALYKTYYKKLTIEEKPKPCKNNKYLEVQCKFCGKYFKPSNQDVGHRIKALNNFNCGTYNLYCSDKCKALCPIYRTITGTQPPDRSTEVSTALRYVVFKRDKYVCIKCEDPAEECHHIIPKAYDPMLSADPDNCISLCIKCHRKIHQQPGCTLPELRKYSVNNCSI